MTLVIRRELGNRCVFAKVVREEDSLPMLPVLRVGRYIDAFCAKVHLPSNGHISDERKGSTYQLCD